MLPMGRQWIAKSSIMSHTIDPGNDLQASPGFERRCLTTGIFADSADEPAVHPDGPDIPASATGTLNFFGDR